MPPVVLRVLHGLCGGSRCRNWYFGLRETPANRDRGAPAAQVHGGRAERFDLRGTLEIAPGGRCKRRSGRDAALAAERRAGVGHISFFCDALVEDFLDGEWDYRLCSRRKNASISRNAVAAEVEGDEVAFWCGSLASSRLRTY